MRALTVRQRQALLLVASGCTGEQIGQRLGVASATVTRHLTEAYRTLGAQDRAHAVALAIHHGHITLAELAAIAGASSMRAVEGPRAGTGGHRSASEAMNGARDVRGAVWAPQGPVGEPKGRAA